MKGRYKKRQQRRRDRELVCDMRMKGRYKSSFMQAQRSALVCDMRMKGRYKAWNVVVDDTILYVI